MNILKLALALLTVLWISSSTSSALALKEGNTVILKLGEYVFRIPEQYSRETAIPSWLNWLPGLDDGVSEALLVIPANEIGHAIGGYFEQDKNTYEDVLILVAALREHEISQYKNPNRLKELWYATDEYAERVVEPVKGKPWFRIYRKPTLRSSWELVSQNPEQSKQIPPLSNYWMGSCFKSTTSAKSLDNLEICKTYVVVENLIIEFSVSQQNFHFLDQIKEYVAQRILSWQVK